MTALSGKHTTNLSHHSNYIAHDDNEKKDVRGTANTRESNGVEMELVEKYIQFATQWVKCNENLLDIAILKVQMGGYLTLCGEEDALPVELHPKEDPFSTTFIVRAVKSLEFDKIGVDTPEHTIKYRIRVLADKFIQMNNLQRCRQERRKVELEKRALIEKYIDSDMPMSIIAEAVNVGRTTVHEVAKNVTR